MGIKSSWDNTIRLKSSDNKIEVLISFFKINVNKKIWGVSAINVAKKNSLTFILKKTPEKFFIINGTPGMSLKIIKRNKEFSFISFFFSIFFIDFLKDFAARNENVDPNVKEMIDIKHPK